MVGVLEMKQEDLVLKDIERCKKIQPIMERLGIEPDAYWWKPDSEDFTNKDFSLATALNWPGTIKISTYRQDKIALALPDWVFNFGGFQVTTEFLPNTDTEIMVSRIEEWDQFLKEKTPDERVRKSINWQIKHFLSFTMCCDQKALQATADLLILLDEEGLNNEES